MNYIYGILVLALLMFSAWGFWLVGSEILALGPVGGSVVFYILFLAPQRGDK